jgi:hypothetical protein
MTRAARASAGAGIGTLTSGIAWTMLAIAVALGSAGLTAQLSHVPGGPQRQELTWGADEALSTRLTAATASLKDIAANVDRMASAAKDALGSVTSVDPQTLQNDIERGNGAAVLITQGTEDLRNALAGLPGDGPDAAVVYSNPILVRRAQILAALDAALTLADSWNSVTAKSLDAARAAGLLNTHNQQVFDATQLVTGSPANPAYGDAVAKIETAKITLSDIASLRDLIVAGTDTNVLDQWINVNTAFDNALEGLYNALQASHGRNTVTVQAAYREEQNAFKNLPSDNRAIVVIVAQIAQGGLNQAVLAINDAQGRIDEVLNVTPGS